MKNEKKNSKTSTDETWWKFWVESLTVEHLPKEFIFNGVLITNPKKFIDKIKSNAEKGELFSKAEAVYLMKVTNRHLRKGGKNG